MQYKLVKGIVVGGLCSIISLDISEIVFTCLDPVVKRLDKASSHSQAVAGGANAVVRVAEEEERRTEKEKRKKKARKVLLKRGLRILLFTAIAYVMVSIMMRRRPKKE